MEWVMWLWPGEGISGDGKKRVRLNNLFQADAIAAICRCIFTFFCTMQQFPGITFELKRQIEKENCGMLSKELRKGNGEGLKKRIVVQHFKIGGGICESHFEEA